MCEHGAHQSNGATVNQWMRGFASAGNANFAPASTVSRNNSFGSLSNGFFLQQMHPSGTMGGFAPALRTHATPMVSANGLLVSPLRDSMPPRPVQVHSTSRPQTALPPPSPAPDFFAERGNVFSRRGGDNFGSGSDFGQHPFAEPNFSNDASNVFGTSASGTHPFGQPQRQFPFGQPQMQFPGAPTPQPQLPQPFFGSSRNFGSSTSNTYHDRNRFNSSFPTSSTLSANQNNTVSNVVPNPLSSLAWRLRPIPVEIAQRQDERCDMKSVDRAVKAFDTLFSGEASQHWIEHVNEIERKHTSHHKGGTSYGCL